MTRYCTQYVINRLGHSRALRDIILLEGYQLKTAAHTRYCGLSGGEGDVVRITSQPVFL